jgi:hypothetical protein
LPLAVGVEIRRQPLAEEQRLLHQIGGTAHGSQLGAQAQAFEGGHHRVAGRPPAPQPSQPCPQEMKRIDHAARARHGSDPCRIEGAVA